ncbi:MAG: ROK family transcriptional regulator [Phycisphaerales bacterium]|nr:MAG: ROK family transcriptional regulator [Phycisphaerales bacterium]
MDADITGTPPLVRVVNRHRILNHIRRQGQTSRAELAKLTGIRPPTVSAVVRQLMDEGLVEEVGDGETCTGTGRPPRMVALSRTRACAVGFEVSGTAIRAGVCDVSGGILSSTRVGFSPQDAERTADRLAEIGTALLGDSSLSWRDLQGVGVAVPGLVDSGNGLVRWSRPLGWSNTRLQDLCEARWETPTDVLNNAVAGSMAEHFLGCGRDANSLIYMYVRFRVVETDTENKGGGFVRLGSGIMINGEPYQGEFGAAGEITTVVEHPLSIARDSAGQPFLDLETFVTALQEGQQSAVAAMDRVAGEVGSHVLHAINFLDPAMVAVESDEPVLRGAVLSRLEVIIHEDRLRRQVGRTKVVASDLGEFGMARGAVVPTLQRVLRMPRLT